MPELARTKLAEFTQSELFRRVGDICTKVNAAMDPQDLLELSLDGVLELFGAERGSIFILRESKQELVLKAVRGVVWAEAEKMVKQLGKGIVGMVAESKRPIFVDDIAKDKRFRNFKARRSYSSPSFICAPLMLKDYLIGVINIAEKSAGERFSEHEVQLLDFLSSQIALNYRRIQLYRKFKSIVKETQGLKDELGKTSRESSDLRRKVELQEKLASVGKLAGGIAHEFNNPLDGVMRYANLCLEHTREGDESCDICRGYLLEIKQGLNRMANIVRSLLACSRNTILTEEKVDLEAAINQAVQMVQSDFVHKDINIKLKLGENLPKIIDLGFERVMINLLRNAVDAIGDAGAIEVSCTQDFDRLILCVKDDGCGITNDSVDMIFEPFYTTKDIAKGCGLGLTIVSEIVKTYNGHLEVKSSVGQGSSFIVTLPIN